MSRIAAALLIVLAGLAINGGLLRPALADSQPVKRPWPTVDVSQPLVTRGGRVLSLLLALEALRLSQAPLDPQKL
jgi:hypothetical protein